ncbi:MAG: glycosyltransferase family 4 protein [Parvularculaceae bacterium]|nr:glycosyltransferase family 4 protein [Parvularculaceae bacterium]
MAGNIAASEWAPPGLPTPEPIDWPIGIPKKAKILFVLSGLGAGGAERVVTALCNRWRRGGVDVAIATFENAGATPYYPLEDGLTVHRLGVPTAPDSLLSAIRQTWLRVRALSALIRKERPSVVVSFLTKINIVSLLAAPADVPVIVSERNNPKQQRFNILWRAARAMTFSKAYAFVAMTQGVIDAYPAYRRPNSKLIPNPVIIPETIVRRSDGRMLAAVGRLTRQKRFDVLLEAFARIATDFPDWRLIIWGEGEERAALERQRDHLGLTDRVSFPGLSQSPGAWLETADMFVLSSDFEGWGNVIVEAMAAGLPVISTDCDFGPREIIEHEVSGFLVKHGDASALAAGLTQILRDDLLRARLGAAAKVRAETFALPGVARSWETLFAEAIAARSRRSKSPAVRPPA